MNNKKKLNIKNRILTILMAVLCMAFLYGCDEQICSYCGEEKECDTFDILGTPRYICKDCLGNPAMSLSGNVIIEYESELVDPELYHMSGSVSSDDAYIAGDYRDEESVSASEILATPELPPQTSEPVSSSALPASGADKDEIVGLMAAALSSYNYYIQPDNDSNNQYHVFFGSDNANIDIEFSGNGNSTKAKVSMMEGAREDDFSNVCININLAFLKSEDYENLGFAVFNNAKDYGNYNKNGCKFYYLDGLDPASNDGAVATYEVQYE